MFNLKTKRRSFLFGSVLILLFASAASAQTVTGTLRGTVSDSTGAVLPGADITIRNVETGQERNLKTGSEGVFVAPFLPLGRYTVTASNAGFNKVAQENIEVTLNQTTVVNFTLNPSSVTEAVVVTSEAAPINTTSAEIKGSLNAQEILDKPTFNQGNFLTLAETFTGFQENPTSGQNNPTASSGSSINFNGTGTRGATFQINGVNNDDSSENQNRQGASLSTIKEFQVISNNFSAEFGRGYGAVVLVQTKAGTNQLHGDAYWYHNDSALNATNNTFSPGARKGVTRRNQFGFTSGFPVFKDRLFSFISLDHIENSGANAFNRDVFTMAERNPANWFAQTPANDTPANRAFIQSVVDRFKNAVPNDPAAGPRVFRGQQAFDFPARDYSGRLDWNPREADTFSARWQYTRQRFEAEDVIPGERADQNHKQQNFGLTWTHIFSPRVLGEFRYGLGLRTTLVNIAAGNDTPIIRFFNPTPITTQSSIGSAGNFPIQRYQTDNQFVYNFTSHLSTHQLRAGTDIRRQQLDDLADNFSRGFYSSTTATCNGINYTNGFNQFINGCTPNFQKGYGPFFLENRIPDANFYFEDKWTARSNLTLTLGLRYEYVSGPREAEDRINYGIKDDKDNWEPRVGFAWSPNFESGFLHTLFGNVGDSSFRGGYGIFHGRIFQSVFSQGGATVRFNPPNAFFYNQSGVATATFNPVNLADPTNGFVFVPGPQTARHTVTLIDPGLEMPYTQQWNLTIERELPFASAFRASYTGNRGIGLLKYALNNLPVHDPVNGVLVANHPNNPANLRGQVIRLASDFQCAGTTGTTAAPFTAQCPVVVPIGALEYSFRVPRTNERRPNGLFGTNVTVSNGAWSYYHGMQLEWIKRLSRNLNFQAAYTWSKAIDTTSEATFVGAGDSNQNGNNAREARALSRFHTPHRFTVYGTYRLPFFSAQKGVLGQAFGGWQFSAVMKLAKGTPFTVTTTALDLNFDGFSESRPVLLDPSILGNSVNHPSTSRDALPRAAFRALTTNDFNTPILGRNTFFLDGTKTVDFGIAKVFRMPWEGHRIMLRADMFNAFNHVQYGFPSALISNTNFGAITGVATSYLPRNVLVSLRYQY
ncbi:MAG TPA: carboxypeptidase regulatory-like domain-containing protein [Pyrinomonadaceae bacterium]|nr:carboxypeptidase regulatory-like domain-containing protein [Pyrinomonadaceae bacterium]